MQGMQYRQCSMMLAIVAAAALQAPAGAVTTSWIAGTSGSWANPLNWAGFTVPMAPGDKASFGSANPIGSVVTLDGERSLGDLFFDSASSYKIVAGNGGKLIMDGGQSYASLQLGGSASIEAPIQLGSFTYFAGSGGELVISGAISGNGALSVNGSGLVFTGNNSYGESTIQASGRLTVGNGGNTGTLGTGTVFLDGPLTFNRGDAYTLPNRLTGGGTLTQVGPGTLTLGGAGSDFQHLNVNAGRVRLGAASTAINRVVVHTVLDLAGNHLQVKSLDTRLFGVGTIDNGGETPSVLTVSPTTVVEFYGMFANSGAPLMLVKEDSGTLSLSGGHTYTGPTLIKGGALRLQSPTDLSPLTQIRIAAPEGLQVTGGGILPQAIVLEPHLGSANFLRGSGPLTLTGPITTLPEAGQEFGFGSGASLLTILGSVSVRADQVLSVNSAFSTVIGGNAAVAAGGRLEVRNSGGLQVKGSAQVATLAEAGEEGMTLAGNGTANLTVAEQAIVTVGGGGAANINLSATNAASGKTLTLAGGTLVAGGFGRTSTQGSVVLALNGGILQVGRDNAAFLPDLTLSNVNVGAGGALIDLGGHVITVAAPLKSGVLNDGGLTVFSTLGSGTLTLQGANTYRGATTLRPLVVLAVTGNAQLGAGDAAAPVVMDGATLRVGASFTMENGPSQRRNIVLEGGGGTMAIPGLHVLTVSGVVSGGAPLVVTGAGTLRLTGASQFTGSATVATGATLQFGGTAPHEVGGLGGAGRILVEANAQVESGVVDVGTWVIRGRQVLRAGGGNTARTDSLGIEGAENAWTGTLDLKDNALVIQTEGGSAKEDKLWRLRNQIASGRAGGTWMGKGITSSTVPAAPETSLALIDNADFLWTELRGQAVDADSLIVVQARVGDGTLDGVVDALDLNLLAAHWQESGAVWSEGDFTGDGTVDAFDLNLLAGQWQRGVAAVREGGVGMSAPVPEAGTASLLLAALPLLMRRGRRQAAQGLSSSWTRCPAL